MDEGIDQPRFRDEEVVLAGVAGQNVDVETANPRNYHDAITAPLACEQVAIDGKLFLPSDRPGHALLVRGERLRCPRRAPRVAGAPVDRR